MAEVHVHSPPGSFQSSYFGHTNHHSIYRPPAPSSGLKAAQKPIYHRSRSNRSISSIPRPISRSDNDNGGVRKRPKLDNQSYSSSRSLVHPTLSTPRATSPGFEQRHRYCGLDGESEYDPSYFDVADIARSRDALSPPPLVNTSYRLAGGLDSPSASFEKQQEEWADQQERLDWRMNRYSQENSISESSDAMVARSRDTLPRTPSSISGYGQKRSLDDSLQFETPAEFQPTTNAAYTASGWHIRSRAWAMTGGLAFKAINFCLTTAFKGFSAGGGQTYQMDLGTPEVPQQGFRVSRIAASEDVFSNQYEKPDEVPGRFPEDGLSDSYTTKNDLDTSTPTLKRGHDGGNLEFKNDWLMVDRPSLSKRRSRASIAGSRNNSYRQSSNAGATTSGASFASPRSRPSLTPNRRASSNSACMGADRSGPSLTLHQPYQKDFSPQTSPTHRKLTQTQSPSALSPEVVRFEKRLRKKARQDDESMTRMNAHLQDLIRQGKEALGSKISIEDDIDDDEGFYEDGSDDDTRHRRVRMRPAW